MDVTNAISKFKWKYNANKVSIILLTFLLFIILYVISYLPYINLLLPHAFIIYGCIVCITFVIRPKPSFLVKIIIATFIFLIIPTILDFQSITEQIGNILYILLLTTMALYIKELRNEINND